MSSKKRRYVSMNREVFNRLKSYSTTQGVSMASVVENAIEKFFEDSQVEKIGDLKQEEPVKARTEFEFPDWKQYVYF